MSAPVWSLLGFAAWTVLLLLFTVGIYRWRRILTGREPISSFRADQVDGEDFYKRAMRAHANCVENLPVFGAIVYALEKAQVGGATIDAIAVAIVVARVCQSLVHVSVTQTNAVVSVRFAFFLAQILGFLGLVAIIVLRLTG